MGFMLALAAAGIELSSFTVLTGAFGVGIGFGLQNIFNNFVSGIILLFERPVQAGDIVEVGGMKGEVRNIGLRASTIRTSLGAEVIVPNSNLISNQVINWTDSKRRIDLEVKVVHGADPAQVVTLMKQAAISNPAVVQEPEPVAVFQGFGEKTLNIELRFWAPDNGTWLQLKSDVAVSVAAKLREAGIYSPAPQPGGGSEGKDGPEAKKPELGGSPDSWTNQARLSRRNS
jgi:small-conductance mechanosensitive channel